MVLTISGTLSLFGKLIANVLALILDYDLLTQSVDITNDFGLIT